MVIHLQKEPEPLSLVKLHIFRIKKSLTHDQKKYDGRERKNAHYFNDLITCLMI